MGSPENYYEQGDYAYINNPELTPEQRYQAALELAMRTANVTADQFETYEEVTRSFAEPRPDISQLAHEARRNGRAVWGVGIISVAHSTAHAGQDRFISAA